MYNNLKYVRVSKFTFHLENYSKTRASSIPSYKADLKSQNRFLKKGIQVTYDNQSLVSCMEKCRDMGPKCQSFNVSQDEKKCHLSKIRRKNASEDDYIEKQGYVYYEIMDDF